MTEGDISGYSPDMVVLYLAAMLRSILVVCRQVMVRVSRQDRLTNICSIALGEEVYLSDCSTYESTCADAGG